MALYYVVNENDLRNVKLYEKSVDLNKLHFFFTYNNKQLSLTLGLTDVVFVDIKEKIKYMSDYVNSDTFIEHQSNVPTSFSIQSYEIANSELKSISIFHDNGNIYFVISVDKGGQTYTFQIYISKQKLNVLNEDETIMIHRLLNEVILRSAVAGTDGVNKFCLFTTSSGNVFKVYVQNSLQAGFKSDLDTENTAMQQQTVPGTYDIVQSASNYSSINVQNSTYQGTEITSIIISRTSSNITTVTFTGVNADNFETIFTVLLDRNTLLNFNTEVQAVF